MGLFEGTRDVAKERKRHVSNNLLEGRLMKGLYYLLFIGSTVSVI